MGEHGKVDHPYDKHDPQKMREFYEEIGHRGGARVKELISKGKQSESSKRGRR